MRDRLASSIADQMLHPAMPRTQVPAIKRTANFKIFIGASTRSNSVMPLKLPYNGECSTEDPMYPAILLAIAFISPNQDSGALTKQVTFSAPAARLKFLLTDLSKAAGVKLRAGSDTENEVML